MDAGLVMMKRMLSLMLVAMVWALVSAEDAAAGEADVVAVEVEQSAPGVYAFHVTVEHGDEGWDHYADRWDVVAPDGTVLGERVLAHPHVNEQPFRRSLSWVEIDPTLGAVTLRAHDSVHDLGGLEVVVDLP